MGRYNDEIEPQALIGLTMTAVEKINEESLRFTCADGRKFILEHVQDCCEYVYIEDICGDLQDLVGTPILESDRSTNTQDPNLGNVDHEYGPPESFTWTFFKFATVKGWVDVRFFGESNGYYSEDANLYEEKA